MGHSLILTDGHDACGWVWGEGAMHHRESQEWSLRWDNMASAGFQTAPYNIN